jgi:hypothetical protein
MAAMLDRIALPAVATCLLLAGRALASPPAPLEDLLRRAQVVRVMRTTAVTSQDATFEATETLRGPKARTLGPVRFAVEPMQGQLSVGHDYLIFSQGGHDQGPPEMFVSVGEPTLGGADYRGWIAFPVVEESGKTYVDQTFSMVDCKPNKCDAFNRKLTLRFVRTLVKRFGYIRSGARAGGRRPSSDAPAPRGLRRGTRLRPF